MPKTSIMRGNGVRDSTEDRVTERYAVEYAKNIVANEAKARVKADDEISGTLSIALTEAASEHEALAGKITGEASARKTADDGLERKITDETEDRKRADRVLSDDIVEVAADIATESVARETSDRRLAGDIIRLKLVSHTHHNKDILDLITGEKVERWDKIETYEEQNNYFNSILFGIVNQFRDIYNAVGFQTYDGALFGMTYEGRILDGGSFGDTEIRNTVDGGDFAQRRASISGTADVSDIERRLTDIENCVGTLETLVEELDKVNGVV